MNTFMPHKCALCGQIVFRTYHEYETHRKQFHGLKTSIKPEKVTGRTPAQIVRDAESTWLAPALIARDTPIVASNDKEHLEACRCNDCFQKKLDALVDSSEKSLASLDNSVIIESVKDVNLGGDNA